MRTRSLPVLGGLVLSALVLLGSPVRAASEVTVFAPVWATAEPCPTCRVIPAVLVVQRAPVTRMPLVVYLEADGTATPEADYQALPRRVEIPAGRDAVEIRVFAVDDRLVEGPEVVRVRVAPDAAYEVRPRGAGALIVIHDDEPGAPQARLDVVEPPDGTRFPPGAAVLLAAIGVWTEGEVYGPVAFYSGETLIGEAPVYPFARPPIPGLPSVHVFEWIDPPAGEHLITARTQLALETWIESPPVRIAIEPDTPRPVVVGIEATGPIAEESAYPYRRMNFVGEFTISRTGPTDAGLPVFLEYLGSATAEKDYPRLPWLVEIPAGAAATSIRVEAIPDRLEEGIETLVAAISNCPPLTDPPLGMPCRAFEIDPRRERATVYLRDDGITQASLAITNPQAGAEFDAGEAITIEATAIDLDGYISHVVFYDGERKIGESNIAFFVAPPPGTPVYHVFEWRGAAPGPHVLRARAASGAGAGVTSAPVEIRVRRAENQPPRVEIVRPAAGAELPWDAPIEIVAEARDPDGYVPRVEFFADGRKIGEQTIMFLRPPEPGQTQTFRFVWRAPAPGAHTLVARATDNERAAADSAPVEILVGASERPTIVIVAAVDPLAVEPASDGRVNTATFRISRFGPTAEALIVDYSLHGAAENGVDYETLSGQATIAAGERSAAVTVQPLADELVEGAEAVVLRLEAPPEDRRPGYRPGLCSRAVALIRDDRPRPLPGRGRCSPAGAGLMHVSFDAETGFAFRVEASADLLNWETVGMAVAADGAVDFVDDEAASFPRRFYRVVPEPLAAGGE